MKAKFFGMWSALIALMILTASSVGAMEPDARATFGTFDAERPGFGPDMWATEPMDHDMAYALYASAAVKLGETAQARKAADFLVAHAHDNANGVGWSLGYAYDACKTNSPNKPQTIYMITTAFGINALLDTYETTGDVTYRDKAREALNDQANYFRTSNVGEVGGFFPYSTSLADSECVIYNANAMQMGTYARASIVFGDASYNDIARRIYNYLWARRIEGTTGRYWYSGFQSTRLNDAVHGFYIVQGFADFHKALGPRQDLNPAIDYTVTKYLPGFPNLWGVGQGIGTLTQVGRPVEAQAMKDKLPAYEFAPNQYGYEVGGSTYFPRPMAHVLWGLAQ